MGNKINLYKLTKAKLFWQERGIKRLFHFFYQKTKFRFKETIAYQQWITKNNLTEIDIRAAKKQIADWKIKPKFSVIMPVYNVEAKWLTKAIESVRNQIYSNWELCITDDASTKPYIASILTKYSKLDPRIQVIFRNKNGNISAASNSALKIATGDYIALLDHDDELTIDALFENAKLINRYPDADFIYSDEDKINTQGKRLKPCFKPDWSPEYFYSCMYTCHLSVYRTSLIRELNGFNSEYDGSQDYDLALRVVEKTKHIYHIPKILYHWRIIPTSAASGVQAKPTAQNAGLKALEAMLERSFYKGYVEELPNPGLYRVRRNIIGQPKVSIIIPSAGRTINYDKRSICLLENCINSINKLTTYRNFEILVVDGYDLSQLTLDFLIKENISLIRCQEPFNFSQRINQAVAKAKGDLLLLLNDDIEIITPNWLESTIEIAQQPEIAAVGVKLLYPDRKIQHSGIVLLESNPSHCFYNFEDIDPGYFCSNLINRNYLAVTGACLMIRKELFERLNGLNEEFPINYNDVDLCLEAHKNGYRNVVIPHVTLIHYESASRIKGIEERELNFFKQKWNDYLESLNGDPYYNINLSFKTANFELN